MSATKPVPAAALVVKMTRQRADIYGHRIEPVVKAVRLVPILVVDFFTRCSKDAAK